jgi:hypothetical protein
MVKRGREGDGRGGVVRDDMMATKNDHDNGGGGGGGGGGDGGAALAKEAELGEQLNGALRVRNLRVTAPRHAQAPGRVAARLALQPRRDIEE